MFIGDDIERIRELRNKYFAHTKRAEISDVDFKELWKDAKCIIQRCQHFTKKNGYHTDYTQMLINLERKTFTFEEYTSLKERSKGNIAICILMSKKIVHKNKYCSCLK